MAGGTFKSTTQIETMVIKLFKNFWAKIQKQSIVNQFQFTNSDTEKKYDNWDGMACARNNNEMINSNKIGGSHSMRRMQKRNS